VDLFLDPFFDYKISPLLLLRRGAVAIAAIAYSFLTPEERRHTMKLGVSIGVPGRRDPVPNLLISHEWQSRVARETAVGPISRHML
jgi:hypothetical protein